MEINIEKYKSLKSKLIKKIYIKIKKDSIAHNVTRCHNLK